MLIRSLAGANGVCCGAVALAPIRSIFDPDERRFHDEHYAPRVALVAYELMTFLLNDATLTRWVDQPGGSRVLFYRKDDGSAVAVIWRPFGLSPTRLAFDNLPDAVRVIDGVGSDIAPVTEAGTRIIEANEMVRYLIAPADQAASLEAAVRNVRLPL
jgi:hypothetical protein